MLCLKKNKWLHLTHGHSSKHGWNVFIPHHRSRSGTKSPELSRAKVRSASPCHELSSPIPGSSTLLKGGCSTRPFTPLRTSLEPAELHSPLSVPYAAPRSDPRPQSDSRHGKRAGVTCRVRAALIGSGLWRLAREIPGDFSEATWRDLTRFPPAWAN